MSDFRTPVSKCHACGMITASATEFHPFIACELFKVKRNGDQVRANLKFAVEYGMKAQRAGMSLEDAMSNINNVIHDEPRGGKSD